MLLGLRELQARITRAAVGKTADDTLLAIAHAYRDFARAHPGVYPRTLRAPAPDDAAIHAIRGLLHGFVTLESAGGFGIPLDLDESFEIVVRTFIRGLHQRDRIGVD